MKHDPARLADISAAQLGRLYLADLADPVATTEFFFDRIRRNADQAIFLALSEERARTEAEASARRYRAGRPLGPLDGVPVAWKDLFDIAGMTTTAGSALYRTAPPAAADATVVRNLTAAGLVALGKVNLAEFAYSGVGLNPHYGTPRNPHDQRTPRIPGGSSSGSAVAVAAGLVPCSIGTDTGGSIRIPAALNGIVGLKTSEGRIDKAGVFPLSPTLDTVGPLARTVEDCVLLDAALRGAMTTEVRRADPAELAFVVPENVVFDGAEPDVVANFDRVVAALERRGARVTRRPIAILDEVQRLTAEHGTITAAEAYSFHRELVEGPNGNRVDPRVVARIVNGKRMTARDLVSLQAARARLRYAITAELDGALLAWPTIPHVAPDIAGVEADQDRFHTLNLKNLRNTMLGNFLDLCGLALPTGRDGQGLPTSMLISAPGGADVRLMSAGLAVEPLLAAGA
ncbi:MAG: aspartyl-tRNA(Asn)/glutamyl-tRNA(Gln) amidotransferase subunit [Rhodospirillaceae bacterium]|nr:aspartyl-tRNA(Asn)/glutamyl-tRNA(Gln) amidotransferase subunit [Rhodospirillaceae bacterium]